MSFVGKILVVLQLVLSLMFVAFAGVVYTAHMNWRDDSNAKKKTIDKITGERTAREQELEDLKREFKAKEEALTQTAAGLDAAKKGLEQEVARLKKESGDLQTARKSASEQTAVAGGESNARNEESINLRKINEEQAARLDKEFGIRTRLEDRLQSLQNDYDAARATNKNLLAVNSLLRQALEAAGINADPNELASKNSPPPGVEGKIMDVKAAKRQGASELVEVSLGSDDGLKKGHEMTVYRSGLKNGDQGKYLARIIIVNTTPQRSVGQVIESSRNGVIQKGDNVSTKL